MMLKYQVKIKCFNTDLIIVLSGEKNIQKAIKVINQTAVTLHNSFNKYDINSELSKLNKTKKMQLSKHLYDILKVAQKYERRTYYHFNTNQTFKENDNIILNNNTVEIKDEIDLGAIAKGYFMLLIKNYLNQEEIQYEINFGGALLFSSDKFIEIRDPNNHENNIIKIKLDADECIHTSSFYWQINGENSHIHQKSSGFKKTNKSISVIDKNPVACDALSTALYSMTLKEAIQFSKQCNLKIIYIENNDIYISNSLKDYNVLLDNTNTIKIY